MALRVSGVSLIVKGFGSFVSNMKTGQTVTSNLDIRLKGLSTRLNILGRALENARGRIDSTNARLHAQESRLTVQTNTVEKLRQAYIALAKSTDPEKLAQAPKAFEEFNKEFEKAIQMMDAIVPSYNAVLEAQRKEIDVLEQQSLAQDTLNDYTAKQAAVLGDFQNVLTSNIPAGQEFAGVLGAIGVSGGTLIGVLSAVAAAFLAVKAAIWVVQKAIDALKFAINAVITVAKGIANVFVKAFQTVYNIVMWATRPLRTFLQHITEIASGIALWRFIRNMGEAIKGLVSEIYDAVSAFQLLEIRLKALAARDYSRMFGTSMAEAFEATSGKAEELFEWLRKLAVQTIFTTQEIADAFTMAVAMGMNVDTAKDLSEALTNYVSAMGLTDEHMWRIIYNLGQMIQRGKLTGEELRDLARNLFPLLEIFKRLGATAGMTSEQLKKLALEGGVPVNDFIIEFIKLVSEEYPGAAEAAARTIAGVTANVRDFIQVFIGVDIFKPVLDRIAGALDDVLDSISGNVEVLKSFKVLGQVLLRIFELMTPAVDSLMESFKLLWQSFLPIDKALERLAKDEGIVGWAHKLAVGIATAAVLIRDRLNSISANIRTFADNNTTTFSKLITKAKEWGLNFIKAFASGIAGGLKLLTSIIKGITTILKTWFAPGSPPLIAPEIDQWGAETMENWIRGFLEADFSIFGDVTDILESYFRSVSDRFTKEGLIPAILQMRDAVARALANFEEGMSISASVNIAMSGMDVGNLGIITDQFQLYLATLLQIQQAEKFVLQAHEAVLRAEADVNVARAALDAFENSLTSVAEAERAVEEASQRVKAIQDQINATTERYSLIIEGLRSQLTQVTDEYDETVRLREIEESLANQRLTDEERERLMMEKRAIEIEQQIRAVEAQRDAEVNTLREQLTAAELAEQQAEAHLVMIEAQAEAQRQLLELEIQTAEQRLEDAKLAEEQAKLNVSNLEAMAEVYKKQIELIIQQNELFNEQKKILEQLAEEAGELDLQDLKPPEGAKQEWDDIQTIIDGIMKEAEAAAAEIKTAWEGIKGTWDSAGITKAWTDLGIAATGLGTALSGLIGIGGEEGILAKAQKAWDTFSANILKIPEGQNVFDWLVSKMDDSDDPIIKSANLIYGAAGIFVKGIALIGLIANWLIEQAGIKNFVITSWNILTSSIRIADGITRIWNVIKPAWDDIFKPIMEFKVNGYTFLEWIDAMGKFWDLLGINLSHITMPQLMLIDAFAKFLVNLGDAIQYLADKIEALSESELSTVMKAILSTFFPNLLLGDIVPWPPKQHGGDVKKGQPYVVGEKRPELFVPNQSGFILPEVPSWFTQAPQMAAPMAFGGGDTDNSVNFEIVANYKNTQSEASIKYDVLAALAAIGR